MSSVSVLVVVLVDTEVKVRTFCARMPFLSINIAISILMKGDMLVLQIVDSFELDGERGL